MRSVTAMRWPKLLSGIRQKYGSPTFGGSSVGWHRLFRETKTGSWQRDIRISPDEVRQHPAVFACMSLIGNDISKCRPRLMGLTDDGIWKETTNPAYSPVVTKPNSYQNRIQFLESWVWSKLGHGNFYGLKVRDGRGIVMAIYPLDPWRVLPLVAEDGSTAIFYQLSSDRMVPGLEGTTLIVPAREIIHDRWYPMHHPLVGMSPLWAAWLPAVQGLQIQRNATKFFENGAQPSGVLTAPGQIDPDTAKRLEDKWEQDFQGDNVGKIAVLGSGLKFEVMSLSAAASQVVDQLKWSGEQVCSVFHVPPYKVGLGNLPAGLNIDALNVEYLSQALQKIVEDIELCMSEALQTGSSLAIRLDTKNLRRMDAVTQMEVLAKGITAAIYSPNEARAELDLPPVPGGNSPYLQQQNYSLEALAKRDASDDPFEAVRETLTGPAPTGDTPEPTGAGDKPGQAPPAPDPNADAEAAAETSGKEIEIDATDVALITHGLKAHLYDKMLADSGIEHA
jgi:HK97 family phage portal protein